MAHRVLCALAIAALIQYASAAAANASYELQPAPPSTSGPPGITVRQWNATGSNNQTTQFTLAKITNPVPHFFVYVAADAALPCGIGVQNTSVLGASNKCIFATNGSPRAWVPPYCQGAIVSNSKLVMDVWTSAGGFGLTSDGFWGIGVFNSSDFARMGFTQYLYGFTWLVRRGVNQIPRDGGEVAPRTSIGTDVNGNLMIFEVDGIELGKPPVGLTVYQQALWWIKEGGYNVINLDGGGSSTVYYNGSVINYPHCQDIPGVWCQRPISVITCIK